MKGISEKTLIKQFKEFGRDLFLRGLVSSHAGNMSARVGDTLYITRRGSMLGRLNRTDIIKLDIYKDDPELSPIASSEAPVHRVIYQLTDALAIIHAHPPYATLLSMTEDSLVPVDWEGSHLFQKVPVLGFKNAGGGEDMPGLTGRYMKEQKVILVGGHGSFARGGMLEEAYMLTTSLEASAFFIYHLRR